MKEIGLTQAKYIKRKYPNNLGKRTKLGGEPEWIAEEEIVLCPKCNKRMTFVSQLDSIDYTGYYNEDSQYIFGDVGMIFTFFCFDCLEVKSVFQCY